MLAKWIRTVNVLSDTEGRLRIDDPTLPRDGTDFMPLRLVVRIVDPTLPRDGTDLIRRREREIDRPHATA